MTRPGSFAPLDSLLQSLAPADRPTLGLQILSATRPFEPNPLLPTVVVDLDLAVDWPTLVATLGSSLPADQRVLLLAANAEPRGSTLAALADRPTAAEALYLPARHEQAATRSAHGLRRLVHRLRAPGGCPWDREQTPESLIKFVLEEAYEVADAIRFESPNEVAGELGDLLLQVYLQAEIAEEAGQFSFNDVVERISDKLIRRHPHVFGDVQVRGAADVERNWEALKRAEKNGPQPTLDGVPRSMPALQAAQEIQRKLKKVGFDWPDQRGVDAKLAEELAELRAAPTPEAAADEIGDVLFILARLALDLGADAEVALRGTNERVKDRFRYVEERARERGLAVKQMPLAELLSLWDEAKREPTA